MMDEPPRARMNDDERLRPTIRRLGRDETPVLVVDDFFENPDELRAVALGSRFRRGDTQRYYPGYQADCSLRGIDEVATWVARRMWHEGFGRKAGGALIDGADCDRPLFSVLCPRPGAEYLNIHVDGHSWLAVLVYLTPGIARETGTAFWRRRGYGNGLESVYNGPNPAKTMSLIDAVFGTRMIEQLMTPLGPSPSSTYERFVDTLPERGVEAPFPMRDHGDWKRIGLVAARYNRLVAYPTWLWHSVAMRSYSPPKRLADARLTLNVFVRHPLLDERTLLPIAPIAELRRAR